MSRFASADLQKVHSLLRPPAIPLVTHDPYLSCWSFDDHLYDAPTRHWTGKAHGMCGLIRVDGVTLRFMGELDAVPPVAQQSVEVRATQTIYTFTCGAVDLTLTFTSPLLPDDLDLLARPASYVTLAVRANDGKAHDVQVYFDATAEWAVNTMEQAVQWQRLAVPGLDVMAVGTVDQQVLATKGDDVRIDWGQLFVATPGGSAFTVIGRADDNRNAFAQCGKIASEDDNAMPRAANDRLPALSVMYNLGQISDEVIQRHVTVAYDDGYAVQYHGRNLRAWWRRDEAMTAEKMLAMAESEYVGILERCNRFDEQLAADTLQAGGVEYAALCVLAYRQAVAAHKLVADVDGTPLFMSKENFSNGSINTVDVTYPSAPLFLVYNPTLLKGMLEPIFYYRESGRWTKPFAPHDSGTYPLANGQTYPEDMPVEESGNMLILTAAIAQVEGHAGYAEEHWATLTEWANYLKEKGFDPENQLCTDDFAGHLAHNANLSIKAIVALGCYGKLAGMRGNAETATVFLDLARSLAAQWQAAATEGDHTRLAFDQPGTWSQKYNLVWDAALGLNLFPPDIARKEIAFYLTRGEKYGLPLDSRKTYTKSDWIMWTAALAETTEDFNALVHPIALYVNETPNRVPLGDWHETLDGTSIYFRARSVVGGYFMKLLCTRLLS